MDRAAYIREFYELYVAGDSEGALAMLTEDVEWRAPDCLPYGGVYHGRDGVATYASTAGAYYDFITVELEDVLDAGGGRVVTTGKFGGRTKGPQVDFRVPFCQIWEFRDGKGARLEYWNDSGAVLRALGLGPTPRP